METMTNTTDSSSRLYPAEITPLSIRAPATALSTTANWIFNFMVVMVTPPAFASIGYNTYTVFACINAFMVPCVYFFYPETAYRSLEEMDEIFHDISGLKGALTVVKVAHDKPRRFGKNGELLIRYEDTEAYRRGSTMRRRSSTAPVPESETKHVQGDGEVTLEEEKKDRDSN